MSEKNTSGINQATNSPHDLDIKKLNKKLKFKDDKRIHKLSGYDVTFNIINYTFFALFALICFYPFYYIFLVSISDTQAVARGDVTLFPVGFTTDYYGTVFRLQGIGRAIFISTARTVLGTVWTVFMTSMFAYVLSKRELKLRKAAYLMVVITMFLNAGMIPGIILMTVLGLTNTFWLYVIPGAIAAFSLIIVKTYIESLPKEIEESAFIDGAGYFTIFIRIIVPCSMPALAAIAVFSAVGHWNTFMDNLLLVQDPQLQTLQLTLHKFLVKTQLITMQDVQAAAQDADRRMVPTPFTVRSTLAVITILPVLLFYPFLQRFFVKGIMLGAVKG